MYGSATNVIEEGYGTNVAILYGLVANVGG